MACIVPGTREAAEVLSERFCGTRGVESLVRARQQPGGKRKPKCLQSLADRLLCAGGPLGLKV